ncbi:calcium-binding protein, partial [Aurantimonas sp. NFXS3]
EARGAAQIIFDTLIEGKGIEVQNGSIFLPNVAPDEGISAPFNAMTTFFGQFFDHGLDLITKGDNGTIFIPLAPDDPLITHGPDGIANTGDELTNPGQQFMVLTRATPVVGADGEINHTNTTTPFVDQNQTYTSHSSHQVFLREYEFSVDSDGNGIPDSRPVATGRLLDGATGGLATWGEVKEQARTMLGIDLDDEDALNIPLLLTDEYGEFIRGPNGLPQIVYSIGTDGVVGTGDDVVVEGNLAAPINTSDPHIDLGTSAVRIGHAFLDDIAHTANPFNSQTGQMKVRNEDGVINDANNNGTTADDATPLGAGEYDGDLFDSHYVTGDGRGNENIALTAIHHVFHSEHNRQVDSIKAEILASGDLDFINEWLITDVTEIPASVAGLVWDGERLFQAGRFATEMQYQHLVFEEFGRKIQPAIDPFVFNASTDIDPSIIAEFANVVYRFGHSMLTETVARTDAAGQSHDIGLIEAFLNPLEFTNNGLWTADEATAAIARGMTVEHGNAIDEFVTGALRNNLLGLPLDLPAINIARARDTGMPTLNEAREQLYQSTGSSFLKPYETWAEFAANLKTPMSVINFIAAYGTHPSIEENGDGMEARRDAAMLLVFGDMDINGDGIAETAPPDRLDFLNSRNGYTTESVGLNDIDMWIGGLAEQILLFGGMLGSTFAALFEYQMEALQDGDRFYYLSRTQGLNFLNELENNAFIKMFYANTDLGQAGPDGVRGTADDVIPMHIGVDAFGQYDYVLEVDKTHQLIDDPEGADDPVLGALGFNKVTRDDPTTPEDESAVTGHVASINALVQKYDANGLPTGGLIDGSEDGLPGITIGDLRENAANLGMVLSDEDLLNAPLLKLKADGTLNFTPAPGSTTTSPVLSDDFEATSLADGGTGVTTHPLGNYTIGAPAGWEIVGGTGGLFDPADAVSDQTGPSGTNVVWLRQGATLAKNTGQLAVAGALYELSFDIGDRTDQPWPGGEVRIVATDGANSTVIASALLPDPGDGTWTSVTLSSGALPSSVDGQELRIEIQQDVSGGGNQILVDTISFSSVTEVVYSSDLTPADMGIDYDPAADPFIRDANGNVVRTGEGIVDSIPAGGSNDILIDPVELSEVYTPGSYLRFNGGEHVVLGGTAGNDTLIGSFGDDAIWGDAGDDFIQGGQGVDLIIGGAGDDIILDDGDEGNFIKGDEGDDVIANSNGPFDILMGGDGKDVIFVGLDDTEVFGGEGDDFIAGGEGVDFLLGNEGDDWIEGGGGFDTTAGDNSELFFDSTVIGHDVMFAGNDEHDFDAESGDDIMVQGESVMRNEGMFGFDWVSFQGMRLDAYADMRIRIFTTEAQDILRNRFDKVEALSGWNGNDQLFGDDRVAPGDADDGIGGATVGANENVFFNDSLTQAGVDRINGLREFLGDLIDDRPNLSAEELEGIIAFEEGNILIGGAGNDRIEGNGGNDIISGDHWLNVRISIHAPSSSEEIATVTTMRHVFDGTDGPAEWAGKSLFELLVERTVKPAQMNIVREILLDENSGASFDTAVFQGNIAEYVIEGFGVGGLNYSDQNGDGFIEVRHLDPVAADGITLGIDGVDYLKGIERLEFADGSINQVEGSNSPPTGSIEISNTEPQAGETLTILLAGLADPDGPNPVAASDLSITWEVEDAFQSATFVPVGTGPSLLVTAAMIGLQIRAVARYTDNAGVLEFVSAAPTEIVAGDVAPIGTNGADVLIGTNGADMINGLGGDDEIFGLRGGDTLDGGAGDDIINGGRGNDTLIGGAGNDILDGGQGGNDTAVFDGPLANFTIEFDPDGNIEVVNAATGEEDLILNIENIQFTDQTITFEEARNLAGIIGTPSGDFLTGTAADEFFFAGAGPDTVFAGAGDDTIFGEGGADVLNGEGGADFIDGGNGADTLNGGGGADTLNGGNGDDLLIGGGGADILNGDVGDDELNGNNGADTLTGGLGNDTINGGNGNDTIIWNVGDGRDVVEGGVNGGPGDTFIVNGDTSSESFDIYGPDAFGTIPGGYSGGAQIVVTRNDVIIAELSGIEEIVINAGGGLDTITPHGDFTGTALSQNTITINGGSGDDIVDISALQSAHRILFRTNGGNDTIIGTLRPQDVVELAPG